MPKMDKEKWIKVTEELTEGPNFFDLIMKSIKEAAKRGIKADSVVINRNMVFVPGLVGERPSMVCGLNAYLTKDDLPDMYSFAVLESQREKTNADRIRAMSDEELAKVITGVAFDIYNCNEGQSDLMTTLKCCDMCDNRCGNCVLSWLKQPAEVTDNEKA